MSWRKCSVWMVLGLGLAGCSAPAASEDVGIDGSGTDGSGTDGSALDASAVDVGAVDTGAHPDTGVCDADGDGHGSAACGGDDCDDADATRAPGHAEVCDASAHDEDCDPSTLGARDSDADGFDDVACCNGTSCGGDCDDALAAVHPGSVEACNAVDDDCDTAVDEGVTVASYPDADGDMFGATGSTASNQCAGTAGWSSVATDCNDADVAAFPGATERCNTADDDCDGHTDEGAGTTYYPDGDGDHYGVSAGAITVCTPPASGYAPVSGDCNDAGPDVHPGVLELCNGTDDDCDGTVDDVAPTSCTVGVGACARTGTRTCGTCSAVSGAADTSGTFHMTAAANGSWDWNCDGREEGQANVTATAVSQAQYCATIGMAALCDDAAGYAPVGTPPGYCGVSIVWDLDARPFGSTVCTWDVSLGCVSLPTGGATFPLPCR